MNNLCGTDSRPPREVISTQENQTANPDMRRVGRALAHTTHQINRALDTCIGETVSQELTGMRGMVLGYIVRTTRSGQAVYQRDLEQFFRVQRSSITTMLQGIERAGFITRTAVEQDARLKSLAATEKGLACYDQLENCIGAFEARLQQDVTEEELASLERVLDKLLHNAKAVLGDPHIEQGKK